MKEFHSEQRKRKSPEQLSKRLVHSAYLRKKDIFRTLRFEVSTSTPDIRREAFRRRVEPVSLVEEPPQNIRGNNRDEMSLDLTQPRAETNVVALDLFQEQLNPQPTEVQHIQHQGYVESPSSNSFLIESSPEYREPGMFISISEGQPPMREPMIVSSVLPSLASEMHISTSANVCVAGNAESAPLPEQPNIQEPVENEENSFDREVRALEADAQSEDLSEHEASPNPEEKGPFVLNFMKRIKFEVSPNSIWESFGKKKGSCRAIYNFVEMAGYFLPPYQSKPICVNYCIGVYEKHYYGLNGDIDSPTLIPKARKAIIYYEIVRYVNKPLGYDSTNLPSKPYLCTLLYNLDKQHFLFALPHTKWNIRLNPKTGFYVIPKSCQGFIRLETFAAHMMTSAHLQNKTTIKGLKYAADILRYVETLKDVTYKLKKKLKRTAYQPDTLLKTLKSRINL